MRTSLVVGGAIALTTAGKMAFAGLGVGTFHVTVLEAGVLAVVGVALIVLGWPWSRRTPSSADLDDEPGESVNVEDVA